MIVGGNAAITEWIMLELMVGIRTSENAESLIRKMEPLHRLAFPAEKWNEAWNLATNLRKEGVSPSASDCFISIVAIAHEATLVHCDADFELIAEHSELQTIDWTAHASTPKRVR
jgi:predicted nucleic acid-binding protein